MTILNKGVQLQLWVGPTRPLPASYDVMSAFVSAEVIDRTSQRNPFTLTFTLGRGPALDYALLRDNVFAPLNRVVIAVVVNARLEVLMDGVVIQQQVAPGARPGEARLVVTGEDLSLMLDREDANNTFPNCTDSQIVEQLLKKYKTLGLQADVKPTHNQPNDTQYILSQQGTDLAKITELARNNTFVFTIEPTIMPGVSMAYWGPEKRVNLDDAQPALTVDMGAETNIESSLSFQFDSLGPVKHDVSHQLPDTRQRLSALPIPPVRPPLARVPASPLRTTIDRRAAQYDAVRARQEAETAADRAANAVTATGEVDVARYGQVLRARRLVGVRGVGDSFGGLYYVNEVRHNISVGSYRQSFTLTREGLGSTRLILRV